VDVVFLFLFIALNNNSLSSCGRIRIKKIHIDLVFAQDWYGGIVEIKNCFAYGLAEGPAKTTHAQMAGIALQAKAA
jgi:hypothetical protein